MLRFSTLLLTVALLAFGANAQTDRTSKDDHLGVGFKPFSNEVYSKTIAINNKNCNSASAIIANDNPSIPGAEDLPGESYDRSLTPCIISQFQAAQDQLISDFQNQDQSQSGAEPRNQDQAILDSSKKDENATKVNRLTGIGHVSQADYKPLSGKERFKLFVNQSFVPPEALLGVLFSAGIDLINHDPPEWKLGAEGYGRRLALRFGTQLTQNGLQTVSAAALHEEPRYIQSQGKGFFHRSGHALLYTLLTYTNGGKLSPNLALIGSTYGASMLTTYGLPKRYTVLGDGVRDGNMQMGFAGLYDLIEEFWPDIMKIFKH